MNILFSLNLEHVQLGSRSDLASHPKAGAAFLTIQYPLSMKL